MEIASRTILRNRPLCDGTPRREKGFRAIVETLLDSPHPSYACAQSGMRQKCYCTSPLFETEKEARDWTPCQN